MNDHRIEQIRRFRFSIVSFALALSMPLLGRLALIITRFADIRGIDLFRLMVAGTRLDAVVAGDRSREGRFVGVGVAEFLEGQSGYLLPNADVQVNLYNGRPIGIELPASVVLTVTDTEPGIKNATATNTFKAATTETGLVVQGNMHPKTVR